VNRRQTSNDYFSRQTSRIIARLWQNTFAAGVKELCKNKSLVLCSDLRQIRS
jgi:hypothetical protein